MITRPDRTAVRSLLPAALLLALLALWVFSTASVLAATPAPTPVPLPDLTIHDATYAIVGPTANATTTLDIRVDFTVWNIGTASTGDKYIIYLLDGDTVLGDVYAPAVSAGYTQKGSFLVSYVKPGKFYCWTISLDPTNRITEASKSNNTYSLTVSTLNKSILQQRLTDKLLIKP